MHIDSFNYFFQVANSKSISTVAKNSHISQSALSQQISKLEDKLNVTLFNRTNKGVSLTPEGEIVFKYTESILNSYNKMQEELLNSINKEKYISIESVESIGLTILPIAISKLKKIFPAHTISLKNVDCCSKVSLLNNLCDIFICYNEPQNISGVVSKLIGTDKIILVADKSFPVNSIKKEQIFELPLIFTSNKSCLRNKIFDELNCSAQTFNNANILYSTNSYFSALNGVSSSKAATFIPASIYYNHNTLSNIKIIDIEDLTISLPLYMCYLDSFYKTNSEFVKKLKNILKGYLN